MKFIWEIHMDTYIHNISYTKKRVHKYIYLNIYYNLFKGMFIIDKIVFVSMQNIVLKIISFYHL